MCRYLAANSHDCRAGHVECGEVVEFDGASAVARGGSPRHLRATIAVAVTPVGASGGSRGVTAKDCPAALFPTAFVAITEKS